MPVEHDATGSHIPHDAMPRDVKVPKPQPELEVIGKVPPAKRNGSPPKDPRGIAHSGLVEFDILTAQRDQLEKDLMAARERIHLLELQIEQIENTRNTIESRINTCVLERDEAVSVAGELRGVIHSITAICNRYQVKHPEPDQE